MSRKKHSKNSVGSKALVAVAFAGTFLNCQLSVGAQGKSEPMDPAPRQILNNPQVEPGIRAFQLLCLARGYLTNATKDAVEAQFGTISTPPAMRLIMKSWQDILTPWADQASLEDRGTNESILVKAETKHNTNVITDEKSVLAAAAIQESLTQLNKVSDQFVKLNMYFISSHLYQKLGNVDGMQKCKVVLEKALQACEGSSPIDSEQVKAATSILNSMAFGLIPSRISDYKMQNTQADPYTEENFKASEKLKLQAVAITDRLSSTDHVRRKAHRDLALWYMELGKVDMAEKEKQILFRLLGSVDDRMLYPQSGGCGSLVWWGNEVMQPSYDCGMG